MWYHLCKLGLRFPCNEMTGRSQWEKKKQPVYDESKIKTLSSLEHIRLRSGMYIGRLGSGKDPDDGIYVLLKEIIDNSVDEFIMGQGRRILISRDGKRIKVRDFGRGIPLGKVVECVSVILRFPSPAPVVAGMPRVPKIIPLGKSEFCFSYGFAPDGCYFFSFSVY